MKFMFQIKFMIKYDTKVRICRLKKFIIKYTLWAKRGHLKKVYERVSSKLYTIKRIWKMMSEKMYLFFFCKPLTQLLTLNLLLRVSSLFLFLSNYYKSILTIPSMCSHFLKISSNTLQLIGYLSSWYFLACACQFFLTIRPLNFKSATKSSKLITGSSRS